MANSIFDFLNFDFSELAETLKDLKVLAEDKYNEFNKNLRKYDLNTEEGYEAFIKEAAEVRTQLIKSDSVFASKLVDWLDSVVEKAMKDHSERNANKPCPKVEDDKANKIKDLVDAEVNRNKNENYGKLNQGVGVVEDQQENKDTDDHIDWPSDLLTPKQKRNVWKLVDEYMDTKVIPYLDEDFDEDLVDDMSSGLFEFAAWILTKEE